MNDGGEKPSVHLDWFHSHPFNVGQHIAHNAMLDECVRMGVDWHIRVDDDCWITTRHWLKRLLNLQEEIKKLRKVYVVLGLNVSGLENPPESDATFEVGREYIEHVNILGGIFRMAPMSIMRYFRWDERQSMGMGDATQMASFATSVHASMFRVKGIQCSHGGSTRQQKEKDIDWDYEHDMLQYIPLGL